MRKFVTPGLVVYCIIAGWGPFARLELSSPWVFPWFAGYLFLLLNISFEAYVAPPSPSPIKYIPFRFVVLGVILLNFAIQVTGGIHSTLWPAYFLFAVFAAAFSPPARASAMVLLVLAVESADLRLHAPDLASRWHIYAAFGLSLAGVSLVTSHIMNRAKREAHEARADKERLIAHADAVDPLADTARIEELTQERRQVANVSAAREREITFNGLIEMIYAFVPAHTYALFLRERRGDGEIFVLRAVRTERGQDVLQPGTELNPGTRTLIHLCAEQLRPQNIDDLSSLSMPLHNLGYYRPDGRYPAVRSFLALPIRDGDRAAGVLAVDSLEAGAFSLDTRDLLDRFSPFFVQIIEKIRMSLELSGRANHFGALHEISADLNSSLRFDEIMEEVLPRIKRVVPYDYCACVLTTGTGARPFLRFIGLDGYDPALLRREFPPEDSAVVAYMHRHWLATGTTNYYTQDAGDRGKDIGLFPFKELHQPVRSIYGKLLSAKDMFLGAFFAASLEPDAFSEYHRSFLDTLLNQASTVAYNSLLYQRIEDMARTDGLTGLLNHRTFMERLAEKHHELDRTPHPFSILLMDIDKFKGVNDKYGHPVGDTAIKAVARVLSETVRAADFVARYGGEEFAVGMVDTDTRGAVQMADRVRSLMEQTVVTRVFDGELRITLSIGVASFPEDTRNAADLVTMADDALYHAKRTGRNRVCTHREAVENAGKPR